MKRNNDAILWLKAQAYIEKLFAAEDAALRTALIRSRRAGLPPIAVSPAGGKLLFLLARAISARRILEVGTLGGYSAIWLARALPGHRARPSSGVERKSRCSGGKLVSLELEPEHAAVAKANLARAGLSKKTEVLIGPALRLMRKMIESRLPLFDMVFIDADKDEYPDYLRLAYKLVRKGGLIVADNTLRRAVSTGRNGRTGVLECNRLAAAHRGLDSIIVPVLGKGVDGMLACVKR